MISVLLLPLGLISASPAVVSHADDPPIQLKLSDDEFTRGDRARLRVKTQQDGYLLVLRADTDGRLRVLFPLGPDDEGRIQGGKEFEVRSRGDHEAFSIDDREGSGTVIAALADQPFHFDDFARNGHWDYRALSAERIEGDQEAGLLDVIDKMAGDQHYDYDVASYSVGARTYSHYRGGWYNPWAWGCIGCSPWYYGPGWGWGWGFGVRLGHGHIWGRRRF
jgi:hypothetical protein